MTFQWTAVAGFLYGEIAVILVLCLPFISPLSAVLQMAEDFYDSSMEQNGSILEQDVPYNNSFTDRLVSCVLRRTVTLLTQLAKEMASHAALEMQVNDATEAAKKYMAENERLQEALSGQGSGKKKEEATQEKLKAEVEHLKAELQKTSTAFQKAKNEVAAVKKHSDSVRREYDHLMKEYERLQQSLNKAEDKKDL
ncbi:B-cell receptor associated protein 29 [Pitangus sulphuratus]|nr:B-cell receptor associated protein 29 [Pitangus sulphuratus]